MMYYIEINIESSFEMKQATLNRYGVHSFMPFGPKWSISGDINGPFRYSLISMFQACNFIMHCLNKDLTAHALFRSYVILILVHMSSGTQIQNQKKSTDPESGQAVLDTSDQLKKMENDLQDTRSNITRAPRTDQPSSDHEFVEI